MLSKERILDKLDLYKKGFKRLKGRAKPYMDQGGECGHHLGTSFQIHGHMRQMGDNYSKLSEERMNEKRFLVLYSFAEVSVYLDWLESDQDARKRYVTRNLNSGSPELTELIVGNQDKIKGIGSFRTQLLNDFVMHWAEEFVDCQYGRGKEFRELLHEGGCGN